MAFDLSTRSSSTTTQRTAAQRMVLPGAGTLQRIRSWLAAPQAPRLIILLALLSSAPTLWVQLDSDDYFQRAALSGQSDIGGIARAPWDLYAFAKNPAVNAALREEGVWPWWTDTDVVVSFFRPLASLTRALDHVLWPQSVMLMQLHSLVWFGLLLWVAAGVYRLLMPKPWHAALALFAFAFDESRAQTIAWLCNRNAIISLTFAFAALLFHHRARALGDRRAGWLAPLCMLVGILGGETALQVLGYLTAYALFLDRGSRRARLGSLAPYGALVLLLGIVYKGLGYGAHRSGFYVDPVSSPLGFARLVPERLAIYALSLFEGVSTDWFDILTLMGIEPRPYLVSLAVYCAVLIVLALGPLFRRDPRVRFWSLGALLAALPACCVRPTDRMLTGAALGGMALVATLLGALVDRTYPKAPRLWLVAFGWSLAGINLLYAPLIRPYLIAASNDIGAQFMRADATLPKTSDVTEQTVVLLNPPWDTFGIFAPLYREAGSLPQPRRFRWLATGTTSLRVARVDANTLMIAPKGGFLATPSQRVLRSLDNKLAVGERIALEGVTFEVSSLTADGRPHEVLVRFDEPLESRTLQFMRWASNGYVRFQLPAIGAAVTLPPVDLSAIMTGG